MKRFSFIFFVAFSLACAPFFSDTGVLVPREVFVGDIAELTFSFPSFSPGIDEGSSVPLPPADFPVSSEVTIKKIDIRQQGKGSAVSIVFVPWKTGTLQIPFFSFRNTIFSPPQIRIASLLERTGATVLEAPRSPLLVPGTTYLLYGSIALVLALVVLLLYAAVKIRTYLGNSQTRNNSAFRVRTAMKRLKVLERQIAKMGADEWYSRFAAVLRLYLGSFCGGNPNSFNSATEKEITARLGSHLESFTNMPHEKVPLQVKVQSLLSRIDITRFSGYEVVKPFSGDIQLARDLIHALETETATGRKKDVNADV